ncbi:MAG TPA: hypothetical protein ENH94_00350 [Phycisphaerales bacterium]|nr:hypothetical protein [Phycisphaerales bacterium]
MAETEPLKPGVKTTEFWLMLIAEIVGFVMASGLLSGDGDNVWVRIVGGAVAVLAALGYSVNRSKLKRDV